MSITVSEGKRTDLPPCDVVLKGGVTSGIVYPAALCEIAKTFSFKNIGGTSAGAIAAALTAAAQRRRLRCDESGYEQLANVPKELAEDDLLLRLFRPNARTKSLFTTVTGLLGRTWLPFKPFIILGAYPLAASLGCAPALIVLLFYTRITEISATFCLGLALLGALCGSLCAMTFDVLSQIKANGYGLITGISDDDKDAPALTTWLEEKLRRFAGLEDAGVPLTFGMLWNVECDGATGEAAKPENPDVNLEMITTNITYGRPFKFPFKTSSLFFKPKELARYFPNHVITWMTQHARKPNEKEIQRFQVYEGQGFKAFPPMSDVPVIVATRMSLSFPVLFSAVPLHAADFSLTKNQSKHAVEDPDANETPSDSEDDVGVTPTLEHCWFSDGGLSSNFPISLFDSPLPPWPTFAINLGSFEKDHPKQPDESKNVHMPESNGAGQLPVFHRFESLLDFLGTVFDAVQNWNDNAQATLPGYRDRVVTVNLSKDEGGLNLDMPVTLQQALEKRGAAAGALIAARFSDAAGAQPGGAGTGMNWANHRWLRMRSTFGSMRAYLGKLYDSRSEEALYDEMVDEHTNAGSYPLDSNTAAKVKQLLHSSLKLGSEFEATPNLEKRLPQPSPELVVRPDLSNPR